MPHQPAHTESATYGKAFAIGIGLNVLLVVLQLVYGIRAHALALVADAVHNLADVLALVLAWGATLLARRRPSAHWTYGLRSASIFAALINGIMLMLSNGAIAWEAIRRFSEPAPVQGVTIIVVAAIGIAINGATALMFMRGRAHDLNIRAAFLHMAGDAGVSLGVVIAGFIILKTGKVWVDPAVSLLIVAVITWSTWGLLRDSMRLALHAAPAEIDVDEVRAFLTALPGVERVLDLHIWAMSTTETALTAHLQMPGTADRDQFLQQTARLLHDKFDIDHTTLQIEQAPNRENCALECG